MQTLLEEAQLAMRLPYPDEAKAIRLAAGVSLQRLAEELGVHPLTVIRWEAGESRPRFAVRARYAEILEGLRRGLAR